jgi:deoxyribodipyrimidine photo-lyase
MFDAPERDPRVRVRRGGAPDPDGRCVVYWMQRAQRAHDNPALDVAIAAGNALRLPVVVFFGLHAHIERANLRHYRFLVEGLPELADGLARRGAGLVLRRFPDHELMRFVNEVRPALVVGDESPLRQVERWRQALARTLRVPLWTVDADVVVPSALLLKEQYAARTIRPRLHARLDEFLVRPAVTRATVPWRPPRGLLNLRPSPDLLHRFPCDRSVAPVSGWTGGGAEGRRRLRAFVQAGLSCYDTDRNHPERDGTCGLSPYLHFGQLGPREVAIAVRDAHDRHPGAGTEAFLEQLIVRRELAVNFVTFNPRYDSLDGCEPWALATLRRHARDRRAVLYTADQLEAAETHDPLWNAAQRQMVESGWMHGYVRMYWGKKILEWSRAPDEAFDLAVVLNDRYLLDGRDPNAYANIAWAVGGKHDRPWPERPVTGTIRWMSFASTSRKFDAKPYIERWGGATASTPRTGRRPAARPR